MSSHVQSIRAYKDITLQQLRSFCETVRVGSLTAAADALGLARPTVWKQVHVLERQLGMLLLEPHAAAAGRQRRELPWPRWPVQW